MNHKTKLALLAFSLVLVIFIGVNVSAMPNPAATYCNALGYNYKIVETSNGGQEGICVMPNKGICDEWSFFKGICGQEYSYCVQQGYEMKTVDGNAVCLVSNESTGEIEEVPVAKLMNLEEKFCKTEQIEEEQTIGQMSGSFESPSKYASDPDFSYWDWRFPPNGTNVSAANFTFFDIPNGWVTSIKDQGQCGSCWAFSTVASLEAKYEINQHNSRLNPDLSEQHEVSCDNQCYPSPYDYLCNKKCLGGFMDMALKYIKNNRAVDDACFPYIEQNGTCSDRCSDYASRSWTINDYTTNVDLNNYPWTPLSTDQLEQSLIDNGPIIIGVKATDDWFDYEGGLFTDDTCDEPLTWVDLNHGVLLVGFNDTGNKDTSYWIVKNQWGSWGDNGYVYIRFNCSGVGVEAEYPHTVTAPSFKPRINLNSPANAYSTSDTEITFNFTTTNRIETNATCDLIINDTDMNTTIAVNNTATTMAYTLSQGTYNWKVKCWEKDLGIANTSAARTLTIDLSAPTYSSNSTNSTKAGQSVKHSLKWQDANLSGYIFSFDNGTETFVNNSWQAFSGTTNWSNVTKTINSTIGSTIQWKVYANDSVGNWNESDTYDYTTTDGVPPTYSGQGVNTTIAGASAKFYIQYDDNVALDPNGKWIFSTNNTGTWVNDSAVAWTATPDWANVTKTLSSTVGRVIGYRWYVNDSAGNRNYTSIFTLTTTSAPVDHSPSITLNEPSDTSTTNQASVLFNCTGADDINLVNLSLYGNFTGSWIANSTNSSPTNNTKTGFGVTELANGKYKWNCQACDNLSQCSFAASNRTLTIDLSTPTFSSNSTNSTYAGQSIKHNLKWQDNYALSGYIFSFDNGNGSFINNSWVAFSGTTNWSNVTKTINSTIGSTIQWKIYANDSAGNWNESDTYDYTTTDGTYPIINLNSPVENANLTSINVIFNCTVSDNYNLSNVTLYGNWSAGWHANETNSSPANNTPVIFTKTIPNGKYKWNCQACDSAGNCAFASQNRTFNVSQDVTGPNVTIFEPQEGQVYHTNYVNVNFSVTDDTEIDSCWYSVDDGENATIDCDDLILVNLTNSTHTLYLYANDTYGNVGSGEVYFTIDEPDCGCEGASWTYICGDYVPESCTMTCNLNSNGTCFTVIHDDVTIDGNTLNYNITGNGTGDGIIVVGYTPVTIINFGNITNFSSGIYATWTGGLTLTDDYIQENVNYDVEYVPESEDNCTDTVFTNVTGSGGNDIGFFNKVDPFTSPGDSGTYSEIILCDADASVVEDSTISGSETLKNNGLFAYFIDSSTLDNVTSSNNYYGFYSLASNLNNFFNNTANYNEKFGLDLADCAGSDIENNILQENGMYDFFLSVTDPNEYCSQTAFINNTGSNDLPIIYNDTTTTIGPEEQLSEIELCNADDSVVDTVMINASQTLYNNGIVLFYTDDSNFTNISSSGNYVGLYAYDSDRNLVSDFLATNNTAGIYFPYGDNNTVKYVNASANILVGLLFYGTGEGWGEDGGPEGVMFENTDGKATINSKIYDPRNLVSSFSEINNLAGMRSPYEAQDGLGVILIGSIYGNTGYHVNADSNGLFGIGALFNVGFNLTECSANSNSEGITLSVANSSITNNFVNSNEIGIETFFSYDTIIDNNVVHDSELFDFLSIIDDGTDVITNLDIGPVISFVPVDVAISNSDAPEGDPSGYKNIGKYVGVEAESQDSSIFLNVSYETGDLNGGDESKLVMYEYDNSWSKLDDSGVNEDDNYVYSGNVTDFSVFAPMIKSSGGGGGGGGAPPQNTTNVTNQTTGNESIGELSSYGSSGFTKDFVLNQIIYFVLNGKIHSLTVTELLENSIVIKIQSDPIIADLGINKPKNFDLNSDGVNDISVELNSISGNKASITIAQIAKPIATGTEQENQNPESGQNEQNQKTNKSNMLVYIIILVVIVVVILIFVFLHHKSSYKYKK